MDKLSPEVEDFLDQHEELIDAYGGAAYLAELEGKFGEMLGGE